MTEFFNCPFCGERIKRGNGWHISRCRKKYVDNMSDELKQDIIAKYNNGYSLLEISEYLKLPYSAAEKILNSLGLKRRTLKESLSQERTREKFKQTCLKHFGTEHNFSKDCPSRKKWEKRLFEEEGITNVFQRAEVIQKIKDTMHKKYSDEEIYYNYTKGSTLEYWIEKLGEEEGTKKYNEICYNKGKSNRYEYYVEVYGDKAKEKWDADRRNRMCGTHFTGLNDRCEKILKRNHIEYEREFPLKREDKIHSYLYDFKINNILLELNGLYWHCSPKMYQPNDLVKFPNGCFLKAKDKWEYDAEKSKWAEENGYISLTIWEDELSERKVLKLLKEYNYGKGCKNKKNNKTVKKI